MRSSGRSVGEVTMEVPLAWQNPVPLTCLPVVDGGDSEDVPPSPTLDPVPAHSLAVGTFQQGFLDCAQEAVRFLTQEEGMSEDNPVVVGLRRHLVHATPSYTPPHRSSFCLPSNVSQRGRFAPYTVPSHCSLLPGCHRKDKHSACAVVSSERSSLVHRCSAGSIPSTHRIERVVIDDLISPDDLQGVLRCLGSPQDSQLQNSSASHSQSSTLTSSVLQELPCSVESYLKDEGKKSGWQCNSLDDSGIAEANTTELSDDVDGVDIAVLSSSDCNADATANKDSVLDSVLNNSGDQALPFENDNSVVGEDSSSEKCSTESEMRSQHQSPSSPVASAALSHPDSSVPTVPLSVTISCPNSSPSSQLALLSSLSTGTHRLTSSSSADNSEATASRIQSLASEILLLLQEEANALDCSDDDEDEGLESDELTDTELEESFELEAEP